MPPLPEAIIPVLASFAPLFSTRVWSHAQLLLLGAILTPGARTVTAALRAMGLATEHRFTNYHRVLNRATWSARQGSRILLGWLVALLVPPGVPLVLGADDTVERRSGRRITATGCDRDAVRSSHQHVIRCVGLKWVVMMRLVPGPWARRVGALPCLTAWCRPAKTSQPRRHKTSIAWVRHMVQHVRRWLPEHQRVLVVDGGLAAVARALACVNSRVTRVSRLRWDAALYHPPGPQPQGKRGRKPRTGKRQRSLQGGAAHADTPWETVAVDWYGGQRKQLWVFSHTALWYTPGTPPVDIRDVLVGDPTGTLRLEAFCCPALQATPEPILPWVVRRWSVEVTCEEARAHLGLETQRQWSDHAIARTTPLLFAVCSLVTVLALHFSQRGQIPVSITAWDHQDEPTFTDCLSFVRGHIWRARYVVTSTAEAEFVQCPRGVFELLLTGLPLAA
jgi:DDE superfamily endonuclease